MAPIKRHKVLQQLSRDHHHGLLLCFKIREGLKKKVSPERIRAYCTYFFNNYLKAHFAEEEAHVFPLLTDDHSMVQEALKQHEQLYQLFLEEKDDEKAVREIEEKLQQHIRFEERQLFNEIQDRTPEEDLWKLQEVLNQENPVIDQDWEDDFWQ